MATSPAVVSEAPGAAPVSPVVATYKAVISKDVERSSLSIKKAQMERSRSALEATPAYAAWPQRWFAQRGLAPAQLSDELLVLARLRLVLDFGAGLIAESSSELEDGISQRWASVLNSSLTQGGSFERVSVTALVRANGNPEWGFERNETSGAALPFPAQAPSSERPELDLYIQNLARLGVQRRIEAATS